MLAKPTLGITEVLDKFSDVEFTCEYKYDGERAQIHILDDRTVQIYSRNAENTTGRYPDIVQRITEQLKDSVTNVVLDAEAVAYDEEEGLLPFQVSSATKLPAQPMVVFLIASALVLWLYHFSRPSFL